MGSERARQEPLAKVCFACWLICERNEGNQKAFRDAGGMPALVKVLNPKYDAVLLEMAAGCICALCESFDSTKALAQLAENAENKALIRELMGIDKLVKLLSA